jgi:DMSO/TMAO reductase YedYZ heme-binding membrane subunit
MHLNLNFTADPIKLSLVGFSTVFILSIIIFSISKPTFVTTTAVNGRHRGINWGKLLSLSVVFGVLTAIILYLIKTPTFRNQPKSESQPVQMSFSKKVSDCY